MRIRIRSRLGRCRGGLCDRRRNLWLLALACDGPEQHSEVGLERENPHPRSRIEQLPEITASKTIELTVGHVGHLVALRAVEHDRQSESDNTNHVSPLG